MKTLSGIQVVKHDLARDFPKHVLEQLDIYPNGSNKVIEKCLKIYYKGIDLRGYCANKTNKSTTVLRYLIKTTKRWPTTKYMSKCMDVAASCGNLILLDCFLHTKMVHLLSFNQINKMMKCAAHNGHTEIIKLMMEHLPPNSFDRTIIAAAARTRGFLNIVDLMSDVNPLEKICKLTGKTFADVNEYIIHVT